MSSNKYNALNISTITPYVNSQIDNKLQRAFRVNVNSVLESNEVFMNDLSGNTTNSIPESGSNILTHFIDVSGSGYDETSPPIVTITAVAAGSSATAVALIDSRGYLYGLKITNPGSGYDQGATVSFDSGNGIATAIIDNKINIFNQTVVPTYLSSNTTPGNWFVDVNDTLYDVSTFGRIKYTGSENIQVEASIEYTGDLSSSSADSAVNIQLYINGLDVSVPIAGGRGYSPGTPITIFSGSGGIGCRATAIISNEGNGRIQNIYIVKTGGGYSQGDTTVKIGGTGIGAKAVAVVINGAITAILLTQEAPLASGIPLVYTHTTDRFHGGIRNYIINLVKGDVLDARISSTVVGTGNISNCKVFQAKLSTKRSLIKYHI